MLKLSHMCIMTLATPQTSKVFTRPHLHIYANKSMVKDNIFTVATWEWWIIQSISSYCFSRCFVLNMLFFN